ncbi:cupin domain-containing protein [Pelagibius litoralis]|uniref:Cupin domain-containing protein n=1 Tax=Pelagibius litoralis TaxID=374515 RepID=A0A967EV24_9PROT|nr:cupin domain-containing protein [Pelagibius litoralis]NIA68046.1 cupin domain-containing protein [Pelagibius litoralis]
MKAAVLQNPVEVDDLVDWGPIPTMIEGRSVTSGRLLHKGPEGSPESGIWVCTPGTWRCEVERDEFCHFLLGRCTYTHDNGEVIEIEPDTIAFFPAGWAGTCAVRETVRKVYMIR